MFKKFLAVLLMCFTALAMAAVDVNKATEAELDSVKGIGPGTSKLILSERKKGEFKNWEDFISRVKGVGDKRAESLSEAGLTVGGKAFKPVAAGKKDDKAAAKTDKKEAKADAKAEKKDEKVATAAKPAASAAKPAASAAAKPAASAAKK